VFSTFISFLFILLPSLPPGDDSLSCHYSLHVLVSSLGDVTTCFRTPVILCVVLSHVCLWFQWFRGSKTLSDHGCQVPAKVVPAKHAPPKKVETDDEDDSDEDESEDEEV